jgi:2'-5' RNA ligase
VSKTRLFTGIPLPKDFSDALLRACDAVRETDPSWRDEKWVAAENLHVTLKFIGWMPDEAMSALLVEVGAAIEAVTPFELPFEGIRPVPGVRRARMLWGTFLDPDGACAALARSVERAVLPFGVEPETRPFSAHATLVRAHRPHAISDGAVSAASAVLREAPESMSVPSASLFSSTLTPRGPHYSEVGSWTLKG